MSEKSKPARIVTFSLPTGLVVHFHGIPIRLEQSVTVSTATEHFEVVWHSIQAEQSDDEG